jgi:hypothetical protein
MMTRFFKHDKNYILQEAQVSLKEDLLLETIDWVKEQFSLHENPMGLEDDLFISLKNSRVFNVVFLEDFYETLAGIYRLLHGDNQLEFIWDGRTHLEHYQQEWSAKYKEWIVQFCYIRGFRRAVVKACILEPMANYTMLKPYLFKVIQTEFPVKITRKKELVKVAS